MGVGGLAARRYVEPLRTIDTGQRPTMTAADVRRLEDLIRLRAALFKFNESAAADESALSITAHRIAERFATDWPAYWRRQEQLAERLLREAQLRLEETNRRSSRGGSAPVNHDAVADVARARDRLRFCRSRTELAKRSAAQMAVEVAEFRRAIAALRDLIGDRLPAAMADLDQTLMALDRYQA